MVGEPAEMRDHRSQGLFMGDHQGRAFLLLLQPGEKSQYPLFVLKEGLTPRWPDSVRIPHYRPLILLYGLTIKTGADIVEGLVAANGSMVVLVDDLSGLPGTGQFRDDPTWRGTRARSRT